jgi:Mn2+/Fe2+ NRAMP family transporter
MGLSFDFLESNTWRNLAVGLAAALTFAIIFKRIKSRTDSQTPERQVAGCTLISICIIILIVLSVLIFSKFGLVAGIVALILAPFGALILIFLSGQRLP